MSNSSQSYQLTRDQDREDFAMRSESTTPTPYNYNQQGNSLGSNNNTAASRSGYYASSMGLPSTVSLLGGPTSANSAPNTLLPLGMNYQHMIPSYTTSTQHHAALAAELDNAALEFHQRAARASAAPMIPASGTNGYTNYGYPSGQAPPATTVGTQHWNVPATVQVSSTSSIANWNGMASQTVRAAGGSNLQGQQPASGGSNYQNYHPFTEDNVGENGWYPNPSSAASGGYAGYNTTWDGRGNSNGSA